MSEIAARAPVAEANGRPSNRIPSLDGLRGVASLVVVTFHIALNDGVVGARPYRRDQTSGVGWLGAMMTFTPLHLLWAGEQAVAVFFVLSGFVLALPFARRGTRSGRGTSWIRFYRSRAVRLYLPAVASHVLAYGLAQVVTSPGATLLVFTAAFCGPVRRLLERRPIQLLGLLSFSLYLVQEPVTIRFALATPASLPLWLALPIELTLALVVAV